MRNVLSYPWVATGLLLLLLITGVVSAAPLYVPPDAFHAVWNPGGNYLEVDVYPDGEWQLAPDCYDWPASCWEITGDRWTFRMARDESGQWALVASSGDYVPDDHGMERALVRTTLAALNAGDPGSFAVFEPAFDRCYVNLVTAIGQGETPAAGTWPEAGPWSHCPWGP